MSGLPFRLAPAGGRRFDVVGLGENCVDHYCVVPGLPGPGGKVRMSRHQVQGGGQVASAMLACQRLGLRARYLGRCGDDAESRAGIAELAAAGVEVSGVRVVRGARSQLSLILVDEASGERAIAWTQGPGLELQADELLAEEITAARVLHVDVTSPAAAARAVALARAAGVVTSIDADHAAAGIHELLREIDLCVLPEDFARELVGAASAAGVDAVLQGLQRLCAGLLVVTRGRLGCAALSPGSGVVAIPAYPVAVVDTTGCGDVFHAALVVALCEEQPVVAALRFASAAAALAARALGARAALPTRAEVHGLLSRGP